MTLLIKPQSETIDGTARPIHVTPQSAGWQYITFSIYHLREGQTLSGAANGEESALVVLSGIGEATLNGERLGRIGERLSVFEEKAAYTLYLSDSASYAITCTSERMEIALAAAPATGRAYTPRLIRPREVGIEERGEDQTRRRIHHLMNIDRQDVGRLLLVEVYTPAGNWSSYPPHKHDTENPPHEAYLEETYYHHVQPTNGFGLQRVYDKAGLDETVAAYDGDLVLVPKGYHMVGALPGCDLYYLNVMAGPNRAWNYQVDPDFHRLLPASGKITGTITKNQGEDA
jgi:5-deoxy-glucuronate isomerase